METQSRPDFPTGKVVVRLANPVDAERIVAFNRAMAVETEGRDLDEQVVRAGVRALFDHPPHGFYVVAEVGGEVVAALMITVEWSDWRNGQFWWIQSVYVAKSFRRRGIYREMYLFVKSKAEESREVCGFRLYVERENSAAQQTYLSLGMDETPYRMFEELVQQTT